MIFDTNFIIDLMRNRNNALAKIKEIEAKHEPQIITAISIHELWKGLIDIEVNETKE